MTRTAATPLVIVALAGLAIAGSAVSTAQPDSPVTPSGQGDFLAVIAAQTGLPAPRWTASGVHTAKGYTTAAAQTTSVAGMKADCDNINLNRKLSTDFLRDVFGPGLIGFFYRCENISPDTNQYWFTITSGDPAQIDKLCDPATQYPIVYDAQHDTYWRDEPFTCTDRVGPY